MLTTEVENYPGFIEGIMGPELMQAFREQAGRFGAEFLTAKVAKVDFDTRPFRLWVGDPGPSEPTYTAEAVIVATGAQALMLDLPNEERLLGYGVSTCATCDGFFFRGQHIAVVGGGDSALEEALFLTRFAESVTVVHRRGELRASKVMQQRAFANPKIRFHWNAVVTDVLGDTKVSGVTVEDTQTEEESTLEVTGLFVAIGHRPNTSLFVGPAGNGRERLPADLRRDPHQRRRGLRLWRRAGSPLPPSGDRCRVRVHGGDRRRALARVEAVGDVVTGDVPPSTTQLPRRTSPGMELRELRLTSVFDDACRRSVRGALPDTDREEHRS